mmetsp:Transcript_11903/g.16128  ORF Transcript_11903/g.16128 Transcript_11903/m.16128 type:complete len:239 (-) Transcript_11903:252-968(-)
MSLRSLVLFLLLPSLDSLFLFWQQWRNHDKHDRKRNGLQRLAVAYDNVLRRYPIRTKMITGALVEMAGDRMAQRIEGTYSIKRTFQVCFDGLLTGIVLHHVYAIQDKVFPRPTFAWWVPFCHILVDEALVDPAFVATFVALTDSDWNRYFPTILASKTIALSTLPVQYLNFRYNPVRYRVFVVNIIDVIWSAAVSFSAHQKEGVHSDSVRNKENLFVTLDERHSIHQEQSQYTTISSL